MTDISQKQGGWMPGWGAGLTGPTTPSVSGPCCGGKDWGFVPVSRGAETIAIVVNQDGEQGSAPRKASPEAIARARLIAAAPDLLEALISLVDRDLTYDGPCIVIPAKNHSDAISIVRRARNVIARARGEQDGGGE